MKAHGREGTRHVSDVARRHPRHRLLREDDWMWWSVAYAQFSKCGTKQTAYAEVRTDVSGRPGYRDEEIGGYQNILPRGTLERTNHGISHSELKKPGNGTEKSQLLYLWLVRRLLRLIRIPFALEHDRNVHVG